MSYDLLCQNEAKPKFNERRKSFFLTTSTTPLRSRPTTNQSLRSYNSAARAFSARRTSIFENESSYEYKRVQSKREARRTTNDYDKGTLEQLMRKRACIAALPRVNVMPSSFNPYYTNQVVYQRDPPYLRNETGRYIVYSQKRNLCENVTQPQHRMIAPQQYYSSLFTHVMENYENDIAVRLRDLYMQGKGYGAKYITSSVKSDSCVRQMYKQPEYGIFTGNRRANDISVRSALYDQAKRATARSAPPGAGRK